MEEQLITHLDECLAALATGESLESCLARYPDKADELAPLLRIALALEELPQPGPSTAERDAAQARLLAEAGRRRAPVQQPPPQLQRANVLSRILQVFSALSWPAPARALATVAVGLALALLISGGAVYAARDSLPGDPLYAVKLLGEDVQRALAFGHDNRIRLEETFTTRRLEEVRQLLTKGRQEEVMFGGLLRERQGDQWRIEDIPVTVTADTRLQDDPGLQVFVEIRGRTLDDGTVLAQIVEIEGDEIVGRVEAIGQNSWQVAGRRIETDDKTHIEERLQVGDCVEVHARRLSDGTLLALEIERAEGCTADLPGEKDAAPSAMPTPAFTGPTTPTQSLEPTEPPEPEETTKPTETTGPTRTRKSTETPEPTEVPEPTRTREPAEPAEPIETEEPTEVPKPTRTPKPSEPPEVSETPEPDETPESDETREPDETHEPDETREPDKTREPDETPRPTKSPEPTKPSDD